jgi:hypothetical protein
LSAFTRIAAVALWVSVSLVVPAGALSRSSVDPLGGARLLLVPAVVLPGHGISIAVNGVAVSSMQAQLVGASDKAGRQLPWQSLVYRDGAWRGRLGAPALLGVYAVRLRVSPGSPVRSAGSSVRVLQAGTASRPKFGTPEEVARWWVHTERVGATLVALKRWPAPAFDLRDTRLYQLLVLAYSPPGHPALADRLGIFLTAFRETATGRWRLLETTVLP